MNKRKSIIPVRHNLKCNYRQLGGTKVKFDSRTFGISILIAGILLGGYMTFSNFKYNSLPDYCHTKPSSELTYTETRICEVRG